jgi:succinate dehydrogenase / fumarate reductase membrane anchor subunit
MTVTTPPAAWERPPLATWAPAETQGARNVVDYIVLRLTGVLLSVLVLGHFVVTHFVTDVARDDSAFVSHRLSSTVWIAWDAAMLAAALAHGATGVRLAFADYTNGRRRRAVSRLVAGSSVVLFVVGAAAIWRLAGG